MKWVIFLLLFVGACLSLAAQNITVVEYFFDSDPGYGSGTSVAITPSPTITNFNFDINISSAADGFHTLFVRAKDANNNWSVAYSRPFYKLSASAVATAPNINKIEYFFDTDPGYGAGTNVPITPTTSITDLAFALPLGSAVDGFHTLFVRTRDANNNWSAAYSRPFYKLSSSTLPLIPNLNKLEYFIDADPGYGAGVNVPIIAGVAINDLIAAIPVTAIAEGNHIISFRARDVNNNWSVVAIKSFSKCNHPGTTINTATSITSTGFTASWADVPGSISYRLDVSTDNFSTFVSGYNNKVITAPNLSSAVTGLVQATAYQYRVRAVASCASVESNTINLTTLATPPSAQPTNLLFSSVTATSFTGFFTAPAAAPTGYLVVRKIGSASSFVPANNATYTLNQNIGDGVVAYVGPNFLFNEAGLTPDTQYFYKVFAYNQASTSISYLTTSPLQNSVRTVALEPTAQPINLQFASVNDVSFSVSFTAATGSPTGYLVLRKTGSSPTGVPADGTVYTTTLGSDAVVHNSAATNFSQTGLTQNTEYFYTVYAYNGSGTSINYRVVSPLQGSQLTPITPPVSSPANLVFSNVTPSSITVSYSAAPGSPAGYLVMRREGSSPTFIPQLNTTYTVSSNFSGNVVAYYGPQLSFTDSGLNPSTAYYYDVFAFNQIGSLIGYQTVSPLEGNVTTFTAEPTAQASGLVFTNPTTSSLTLSFTAASPAPTGYLVLRKASSAPTSLPVDGQAYALLSSIGDGTVAYVGSVSPFVDSGLLPGTTYHYQFFSYNGSGAATNYLMTLNTANTGSKITVPGKPATPTANEIGQTQFRINWTATTGSNSYRLDVSKDNFVTRVAGFDNLTVSGLTQLVNGLENGTAYKYRIRAVNESGTSVNSDEAQQFTIPATPVLSAATNIGQTSFTANWTAVTSATEYFIDVSLNSNFIPLVVGYENKSVGNNITAELAGLTSGTTHYYRIRSKNDGGVSPNSTTKDQLLIPATPLALDGSNAIQNSFKANWQPVVGADRYEIDISLAASNFNPILFTENNILGNQTEYLAINLTANTAYSYRVRAANGAGKSDSSVPKSISTTPQSTGIPLQLSSPVFTAAFTSASNASIEVSGGTAPYVMQFFHRKITSSDDPTSRTLTATGTTYQTAIDASILDDLGVEFYFKVTDANGAIRESAKQYIYKAVTSEGIKIPFTRSGGTGESYELFSIPYQLTDNLIASIFEELGAYKKSQWRLLRYQGGRNVDFGEGINRIEIGKGYWFNRKENVEISFSGGIVVNANQTTDAVIRLEPSWNQIGNPFPFDVDWNDILAYNASIGLISNLRVFNPVAFNLDGESNTLKTWGGGYVHNGNSTAVDLKLPVSLKNTAGGRKTSRNLTNTKIDQSEWLVPITIRHGEVVSTSGIGMHPQAAELIDPYDDFVVPRFLNYLELYAYHDEFFTPKFSMDVVPTTDTYHWDLEFATNGTGDPVSIQWDQEAMGVNHAQLILYDVNQRTLVNMKTTSHYTFQPALNQQFRIFYGSNRESLRPDITVLGNAYPNPFSESVPAQIPFMVMQPESRVVVNIIDMMGRSVKLLVDDTYGYGVHETMWRGETSTGDAAAPGMYLIEMEVDGRKMTGRIIKR